MYLVLDTETTGLPKNRENNYKNVDNWPYITELAWEVYSDEQKAINAQTYLVYPRESKLNPKITEITGIRIEDLYSLGLDIKIVLDLFMESVKQCTCLIAHNMEFDLNIIMAELYRSERYQDIVTLQSIRRVCTMKKSTNIVKKQGKRGYKWPNLSELHEYLFNVIPEGTHRAMADVIICGDCFFELLKRKEIVI